MFQLQQFNVVVNNYSLVIPNIYEMWLLHLNNGEFAVKIITDEY